MTETELIREISAVYRKHGWVLRRILLKADLRDQSSGAFDADASIAVSDINALLFSRSTPTGEAWEMRAISRQPFALFENFGKDVTEREKEIALGKMKKRLKERAEKSAAQK